MIRWLLSKLLRPSRDTFRFFNGVAWVEADPVDSWIRFKSAPDFDFDNDVEGAYEGKEESLVAVAKAARYALPIPAFADGGLPVHQASAVAIAFFEWLAKKNDSTNSLPTLQPPTASTETASAETNISACC